MNGERYERIDFHLSLREIAGDWQVHAQVEELGAADGPLGLPALAAAITAFGAPATLTARLAAAQADRGMPDPPAAPGGWTDGVQALFAALFAAPAVQTLYRDWRRQLPVTPPGDYYFSVRLVLHIDSTELALFSWERMRSPDGEAMPQVVRAVTATPQTAAKPLQMPMHIRQWDIAWPDAPAPVDLDTPLLVEDVFRSGSTGLPHAEMGRVVDLGRAAGVTVAAFGGVYGELLSRQPVARIDILHLTGVRAEPQPAPPGLWVPPAPTVSLYEDPILRALLPADFAPPAPPANTDEPVFLSTPALLSFLAAASVRLLVLQVAPEDVAAEQGCLLAAQALAAQGGPAVLVIRPAAPALNLTTYFGQFYDAIIHDAPLDVACRRATENAFGQVAALIVGARGEDLVRFAAALGRAYRRRDEVQARLDQFMRTLALLDESQVATLAPTSSSAQALLAQREWAQAATARLAVLQGEWQLNWSHESSSSIPIAANASELEGLLAQVGASERALADHLGFLRAQATPKSLAAASAAAAAPARYVNTWLTPWGETAPIPADRPLQLQAACSLHVDIGPRAAASTVVDPVAIPSEALQPIVAAGGAWLHIAVYSLDFQVSVAGEPATSLRQQTEHSAMQRFWLPATLESQPIEFRVVPQRTGLAYLRICIYYRNQLLQSLRLDARVEGTLAPSPLVAVPGIDAATAARLHAAGVAELAQFVSATPAAIMQATGVGPQQAETWLRDAGRLHALAGYAAFIEYTTSADFRAVDPAQARAATIFTNAASGTHFVGVKIGDWDEAWGEENDWTDALAVSESALAELLPAVRACLDALGTVTDPHSAQKGYRFPFQNTGDDDDLKRDLPSLAYLGRDIYEKVFSHAARLDLKKVLQAPGQIIHIARVMEGEVLPWAITYDLDLDLSVELNGGSYETCLKLFEHKEANGEFAFGACSAQAGCPLKTAAATRTVCPWGFWGVKHTLEQPAQRIAANAKPRELVTEIVVGDHVSMCMNVSTQLQRLDRHRAEIEHLPWVRTPLTIAGDDRALGASPGRDQVLAALQDRGLQMIYFYCHGGSIRDRHGLLRPYLAVGSTDTQRILPGNLNEIDASVTPPRSRHEWPRNPLVFINGCETATLDPRTMGHFVQVFAEHGAAGVIGTEVPVWEDFATAFATEFIAQLYPETGAQQGSSVGQILRRLRHHFLEKRNSLGLVYSNYCSADLRFVKDGAPSGL